MEKFKNFFKDESSLEIEINEKFIGERGRINCSLRERWILEMVRNSIRYK